MSARNKLGFTFFRWPGMPDSLRAALADAERKGHPPIDRPEVPVDSEDYVDPLHLRATAALCAALQRQAGDKPFELSDETVERVLGRARPANFPEPQWRVVCWLRHRKERAGRDCVVLFRNPLMGAFMCIDEDAPFVRDALLFNEMHPGGEAWWRAEAEAAGWDHLFVPEPYEDVLLEAISAAGRTFVIVDIEIILDDCARRQHGHPGEAHAPPHAALPTLSPKERAALRSRHRRHRRGRN